MYNKLFTKILDSTIWLEPDTTRLVWITFLAVMDEDGFVALSSIGNVAARARVSIEGAEAAIEGLEGPDITDPPQEYEGRRIERVPYGWMVLNSGKYRDIIKRETAREQTRIRVARHRERHRGNGDVTHANEKLTPSVSEAVSETLKTGKTAAQDEPSHPTTLPLRTGKEFQIPESLVGEWTTLYPNVDVPATIKEMRGWCLSNPERQKTRRGVLRFVGRWLQSEQEKFGVQAKA